MKHKELAAIAAIVIPALLGAYILGGIEGLGATLIIISGVFLFFLPPLFLF